ncbi:MAG: hypothetical protein ACYDHO_07865 [Gaiellaceae bacterium]
MPLLDNVFDHEADYVCLGCGYGVALPAPPPSCPMCHGIEWDRPLWRPFTSLDEFRARFEPPEEHDLLAPRVVLSA